ncbi:hypothetical protein T484DRAFT_1748287 [Baffinella frigidus]|nr:hypothetical protein T484DRAFT_1748287 [Cryptophyta sp. CCMP2293]
MEGKAISRKVIVVGNSGVGKTALVLRFVQDTYKEDLAGTIGGESSTCIIPNDDLICTPCLAASSKKRGLAHANVGILTSFGILGFPTVARAVVTCDHNQAGSNLKVSPSPGSYVAKTILLRDQSSVCPFNLQIWDTAGQERFRSMVPYSPVPPPHPPLQGPSTPPCVATAQSPDPCFQS